jgi:hypothetical protein
VNGTISDFHPAVTLADSNVQTVYAHITVVRISNNVCQGAWSAGLDGLEAAIAACWTAF